MQLIKLGRSVKAALMSSALILKYLLVGNHKFVNLKCLESELSSIIIYANWYQERSIDYKTQRSSIGSYVSLDVS